MGKGSDPNCVAGAMVSAASAMDASLLSGATSTAFEQAGASSEREGTAPPTAERLRTSLLRRGPVVLHRIARDGRVRPEDERVLVAATQSPDSRVRQQATELVMRNYAGLVRHLISPAMVRAGGEYGVTFEELELAGQQALLKAAEHFDPARGVQFSTYASDRVKRDITRHIAEASGLGVRAYEELLSVGKHERLLEQQLGREARADEVAGRLSGMSAARVTDLRTRRGLLRNRVQLDAQVDAGDGDSASVSEVVADRTALTPEGEAMAAYDRQVVLDLLDELSWEERMAVTWRWGLDGAEVKTPEEIAAALGKNPRTCERYYTKALNRLRIGLKALANAHSGAPAAVTV